jgi:hypothetical protein
MLLEEQTFGSRTSQAESPRDMTFAVLKRISLSISNALARTEVRQVKIDELLSCTSSGGPA